MFANRRLFCSCFCCTESSPGVGLGKAFYVGTFVAVSAALISVSTIHALVATQIKGVSGPGQSPTEKRMMWDKNTQWSLPKVVTLRLIIPGLYGYRMDMYTTTGKPDAYYWGTIAEDPVVGELQSSDPEVRSNAVATLPFPADQISQVQTIMAGNDMATKGRQVMEQRQAPNTTMAAHGQRRIYRECWFVCWRFFRIGQCLARKKQCALFHQRTAHRFVWFWGGAALVIHDGRLGTA